MAVLVLMEIQSRIGTVPTSRSGKGDKSVRRWRTSYGALCGTRETSGDVPNSIFGDGAGASASTEPRANSKQWGSLVWRPFFWLTEWFRPPAMFPILDAIGGATDIARIHTHGRKRRRTGPSRPPDIASAVFLAQSLDCRRRNNGGNVHCKIDCPFRSPDLGLRFEINSAGTCRVKIMKWEYQIVRADSVENFFQSSLNRLGSEGWEAISGAYGVGESKNVSLGQGMPPSVRAGASTWVALMKRTLPD